MQDTLVVPSNSEPIPGYKVESITEYQINQINMNQNKKRNSSSILSAPVSTSSSSSGEEENIIKKKKKTAVAISNSNNEEEDKPKRTRKNETICTVCEKPGDLLMCDGLCLRSFHVSCLGSSNIHLNTNPDGSVRWECNDCVNQQNHCFSCKKRGIIGMDLMKCKVHQCGKFYHYKCVSDYKLAKLINTKTPRFNCPLHYCAVCEVSGDGKQSVHCFRCPTAYHVICMQPGVKMLTKSKETRKTGLVLCPKHINEPNPNLPNGLQHQQQFGIHSHGNHHQHHHHHHQNHQHHLHHQQHQQQFNHQIQKQSLNSITSSGEIYPAHNNNNNNKIVYNNNISKQPLNNNSFDNNNNNPLYYLMYSSPLSSPTHLNSPPSSPSYSNYPSSIYRSSPSNSLSSSLEIYKNNSSSLNYDDIKSIKKDSGTLFPLKREKSLLSSSSSIAADLDDLSIISSLASIKEKVLITNDNSDYNTNDDCETQNNNNHIQNQQNDKKTFCLERNVDDSKLVEQFFLFAKSRNFIVSSNK